jgi:hypothetical protein
MSPQEDPIARTDGPDAANGNDQSGVPSADAAAAPDAYAIPHDLAQATLDYLSTRPYREVFALVRGFESLQPLSDADDSITRK